MISLVRESQYEQTMLGEVEPRLAALREDVDVSVPDGTLRAQCYMQPGARRALLLLHGYTESCEKYREMIGYFLDAGYSVFTFDQRGHGHSLRQVADLSVTHVDRFSRYVDDVDAVYDALIAPRLPAGVPLHLFAHSMGGAVGALALMRTPKRFERAVLNAPMIAARSLSYPRRAALAMAAALCLLGQAKKRAFVGKPFDPAHETFERSHATSRARFDYYQKKRVATPQYQNCAPTCAWIREVMGVTETLLCPKNARKIETPTLLIQAENDNSVHLTEQEQFASLVPGMKICRFAARHEIFLSDDETMKPYLETMLGFLTGETVRVE